MPYIKQDRRKYLDEVYLKNFLAARELYFSEGDLNYMITKILHTQLEKVSYGEINRLTGVLECAKLELYRKVASPYEDLKIKENGDV
jgi:hypothetical protein